MEGAGFVQRKLASSVPLVHTITMDNQLTAFRLQEKGGPIDADTLYNIGAGEVQSRLLKKEFLDTVTW
jgi:hypothetical protein